MGALWHWLVHVTGCDYGAPYGHFVWYDLYSGFAASYPWLLLGGGLMLYVHHTCQHSVFCLRWGKFPVAGGLAKTCHRHHPDLEHLNGRRPRGDDLRRLHIAWKAQS